MFWSLATDCKPCFIDVRQRRERFPLSREQLDYLRANFRPDREEPRDDGPTRDRSPRQRDESMEGKIRNAGERNR